MSKVSISPQAQSILALCEKKIELRQEAIKINLEVNSLILKIKELSDRQHSILSVIGELDEQIERLSHSV